jgi:hypothetical protein
MNTNSAIPTLLASGERTRSQIAHELELSPPTVAGALVTLVAKGQIVVSGKTRIRGKDVALYALSDRPAGTREPSPAPLKKREASPAPLAPLADESVAQLLNSNLYQIWGGYFPLDATPLKSLAIRQYIER